MNLFLICIYFLKNLISGFTNLKNKQILEMSTFKMNTILFVFSGIFQFLEGSNAFNLKLCYLVI